MSLRNLILVALLAPFVGLAQTPTKQPKSLAQEPPNALTMQLLMAQRPKGITEAQWKEMVLDPTTAVLFPIRVTRVMLDTIDATQLDLRWQYVMVKDRLDVEVLHPVVN